MSMSLWVDASKIGSDSARMNFVETIKKAVSDTREFRFWTARRRSLVGAETVLVACDFSALVKAYDKWGIHTLVSRARQHNLGFCAILRTEDDLRWVDKIDSLMWATEGRIMVVQMKRVLDKKGEQDLRNFISRLSPRSLFGVRYSTEDGLIWLEFGDGKQFLIRWGDLPFSSRSPRLRPETATITEDGDALQMLDETGHEFDIDAEALRARLFPRFRKRLEGENKAVRAQVGRLLFRRRREAGLTQEQLARRAALDQAVISRIEKGQQRPRVDTLERIASALGLDLSELLAAGN